MKREQLALILQMAAKGYTLAKYLSDSGIGSGSVPVRGMVAEIMDLREIAATKRHTLFEHRPIADVTIHLEQTTRRPPCRCTDDGFVCEPCRNAPQTHTPTGFAIVKKS